MLPATPRKHCAGPIPRRASGKKTALNVEASRMLAEPKVSLRLEELQAEAAVKHGTTIDSLTRELEAARDGAMSTGQFSAAVSATMGNAKLHGLLVERVRSNVTNDLCLLTDAELAAKIRELEAIRSHTPDPSVGEKKPH